MAILNQRDALTSVIRFLDERGTDQSEVGGKGANLGRMAQAGLPVPSGFTVTVGAYRDFIAGAGLGDTVSAAIATFDYNDAERLEQQTAALRQAIIDCDVPASLMQSIEEAYLELGPGASVAVRSSGTAEDLADASFAGLHDTILGVHGVEQITRAMTECWASMWSARATSYRNIKGFDQASVGIAVVVQTLVESDVAGVLFTGNPLTAATDEYMVNASWGLGESVVSGIITPDEFLVRADTFATRRSTLGTKSKRIVRDPSSGQRTIEQPVDPADQERLCLSDADLTALCRLGRSVTEYYDHIPQDIEWALADGALYLLQSRPITGVEFAWDELVDDWQSGRESDDTIWSRAWADNVWTGAITPLMYSWRGDLYTRLHAEGHRVWGDPTTADMRLFKYAKAEAYENTEVERSMLLASHPAARAGALGFVPPAWREEVQAGPFSYLDYLKIHARVLALQPKAGLHSWIQRQYKEYIYNPEQRALARAVSDEQLGAMSDGELKEYIEAMIDFEVRFFEPMWTGFFIHFRDSMTLLAVLVNMWYESEDPSVFNDLITGVPRRTATMIENQELYELAHEIRHSAVLRQCFDEHEGPAFFEHLADSEEGQAFRVKYDAFLVEFGHRGQADRDIFYPRRIEDRWIDYNSFRAFLSTVADIDPEIRERETNERRDALVEEILGSIRLSRFGALKAEAFKLVLGYVHDILMYRDNERHFTDELTWAGKRGLLELNRRLLQRGLVDSERDYYFLTRTELYDLLDGRANMVHTAAKIKGRTSNFDAFLARDFAPPMYLQAGQPVELDPTDETGGTRGAGTSRGTVTATARIVKSRDQIGRVREGEILVTNATDPGWTPVFMIISGIVLETGGALAHGSCLAREYGLPAVQLPDAMRRIPDGATMTIDGSTGMITIEDDPAAVTDTNGDAALPGEVAQA